MATIRQGKKQALLIVDVQVEVMKNTWQPERVVSNILLAVNKARQARIPIIWIQHNNEEVQAGSAGWQLMPGLAPLPDEKLTRKQFNSSFEATDLDTTLDQYGVSHIVLAGAATNWCIRSTAFGALDRGYDLTLIGDAHTTVDQETGTETAIPAQTIIDEFNIGMKWIEYPQRKSTTVSTAELEFISQSQ